MNRRFTPKDLRDYSLGRAIIDTINTGGPIGLEKEIGQELATYNKRTHNLPTDGFAIPLDALVMRDLTTGTAAQGGNAIQNTLGTMVDILRAKSVVLRNGCTFLRDLKSGETLPRQSGTASVTWQSETAGASESDGSFDQLPLTPHRITGWQTYSIQLLLQTNGAIETIVQNDLAELVATALDSAALLGTGSSNMPRGVANTSGIGSVTFGGPVSYAKLVASEKQLADSNVDTTGPQPPVWIISPAARAKMRLTPRQSAGVEGKFILDSDNQLLGYRTEVSNQVSATSQAFFISMQDLVVAFFGGGLDLVIDPYSLASTRQVRFTVNAFADVVLRHAASASVSSDSAAQ